MRTSEDGLLPACFGGILIDAVRNALYISDVIFFEYVGRVRYWTEGGHPLGTRGVPVTVMLLGLPSFLGMVAA